MLPRRPADDAAPVSCTIVSSPILGTFYRAQAPGAAPFVDVGTRVEPDTIVVPDRGA